MPVHIAPICAGARRRAAIGFVSPAFRLKLSVQPLREMTERRCGFPQLAILILHGTQF